jgi:tetratricopeptide (TPR) repeat protein
LATVKDFPAAEKAYRQVLELMEARVADAPREPALRKDLMNARANLGALLKNAGRLEEAAGEFRRAVAITDALAAEFPEEPYYQYLRAKCWSNLGTVLRRFPGHREEGIRLHRQAIQACTVLVAKFPEHRPYRTELVRSHFALGIALGLAGRWKEAEQAYETALAQCRDLPRHDDDNQPASVHNELAWLLATCPDAAVRDGAKAVALARKAVELEPKGEYWNTLGVAHYRAGNFKEGVAALETSMKLRNGGDSSDWFFLAMAHWQLGDKEQARRWYDKALGWMLQHRPKDEELCRFRAEAEALLGPPATPPVEGK